MLSVVIPAYNCEKYIERCIKSVLKQTYKNIEIIVIDDGSTDRTEEICNRLVLENKNIVYKRVVNGGCSAARNLGIKMANGKYIAFLDSDDWLDVKMYEKMMKKIEEKDADIVICGYKKIGEKGNLLNIVEGPNLQEKKDFLDTKMEWFSAPWNKIYSREMIDKYRIKFLVGTSIGEDMLFNFLAFYLAKKIVGVEEPLYNYYMNMGSISNNYKNRLDIYIILENLLRFLKKRGDYEEYKEKLIECFLYHGIRYPFDVLQDLKDKKNEDWKVLYEKIKKRIKRFDELQTKETRKYYGYRVFRLKMMFLKKYKKMIFG